MNMAILHVCVILASVFTVGCKKVELMDEVEARAIANEAIYVYCKKKAGDCQRLEFVEQARSGDLWLVEYRSDRYLLAITVSEGGATEVSHFREDRPGKNEGSGN